MAKLIIEFDIDSSDWEEADVKNFVEFAGSDWARSIHVEIGGPHVNEELADKGVAQMFDLNTEYFKARIEE